MVPLDRIEVASVSSAERWRSVARRAAAAAATGSMAVRSSVRGAELGALRVDVELPAHDLGGQCRPALTGPHHDAHTTARLDHAEGFQSAHAVAGEGARDAVAGLNALQGQ